MTLARAIELATICFAALVLASRSRKRLPLRPLAACLCLVAILDIARICSPPRSLDVALYAAWYCAQALVVGVGLLAGDADREDK